MPNAFPSIEQLKRAIQIQEQIEALQQELHAVLVGRAVRAITPKVNASGDGRRKGKRSTATSAKMAVAQKARWAKKQEASESPEPVKKKRVLSEEARKKIADAQKRRWAATRDKK